MMRRYAVLTGLAAMLAAGVAWAESATVDRIMRELRGLGYAQVSVERTLLGRARILADSPDATREIIVNPNTGEILRDLWIPRKGSNGGTGGLINTASPDDRDDDNSGSGKSGDDDDSDDDDDGDHGGSDDNDGDDDDGGGRGRGRGGDDD